ncbi:uncharacterized protein PGTG_22186 [Puccinia graminis f. sp. tritici CRL 75-36-700-3]|uniref:Uncharacterized protein n=1 Tax=Puccinia graminis f. sp. tritici (strain CRL 75-36-700-3 / race SCCL) TaxID=418459 RepID=H6QTU6_PUCGT|nr:uncharacterized protein PGTG_22186 [Puccinia graminis f. sp. tritici CRL 75-36-700-3]EHS64362.1 hypothetical protein PGTG_22186 [Puccinia graminis f. sp. tritici CRL 75-36-700-3]
MFEMESVTRRFASAVVTAVTGAVPELSQVPAPHQSTTQKTSPRISHSFPLHHHRQQPSSHHFILQLACMRYSQPRAVTDEHCLSELTLI